MRGGKVGVLGGIVLVPSLAMAQVYEAAPPPAPSYRVQSGRLTYTNYDSDYIQRARTMRRVGIPLTIAGAISLPLGIILASSAAGCSYSGTCSYTTATALNAFGAIGIIGGVGALGAGIPLWAVGSHRLRRAGAEGRLSLLPRFGVEPTGAPAGHLAVGLTY